MEEVNCDLCNSTEKKLLFQKQGLLCSRTFCVVKCLDCGLIYTTPRLTPESTQMLYSKSYYGTYNMLGASEDMNKEEMRNRKVRSILEIINSARPLSKVDKILDIGCGKGDLIRFLSRDGYMAEGTEISSYAYNCLKSEGLNVHHGDISQGLLKGKKYDIIVSTSVIEHVYSPKKFLQSAYELLNERGIFLCTTDIAEYFLKKEKSSWKELTPDVHIYYFGEETLKRYFRICGFIEADQYNYYINKKRRINRLAERLGIITNNKPITRCEKIWHQFFLRTIDSSLKLISGKPLVLWNIPLMRRVDQ